VNEEKCSRCGAPAGPDAAFCERCGAALARSCAQCGAPAQPDAAFCERCGEALSAAAQPVQRPAAAAPAPSYVVPATQMPYHGLVIRFVALLIDGIILAIVAVILNTLFGAPMYFESGVGFLSITVGFILSVVIALLYFTYLLGRYGQTVGKMALKIKVVNEADGSPITYQAAFIRTILLVIDGLFAYLVGALLILTSDKNQRLGDRVAHTVVVKV
jgi:uncharacterized RDD family membrane protein YckC